MAPGRGPPAGPAGLGAMAVLLPLACLGCLAIAEAAATTPAPVPKCKQPPLAGNCTTYLHKWYYDGDVCRTFTYGGCNGNLNRFNTEYECLAACAPGHTLPPYMISTTTTPAPRGVNASTTPKRPGTTKRPPPTEPPVPLADRGHELTFAETGRQKVFMMTRGDAFIQVDDHRIPTFQLRLCREISFQFRTRLPHGLLVYHSVKNRPGGLEPYALYVIVEKGQLKVVHVIGKHSTSVTVGEGLNRDTWHTVLVRIDVPNSRLLASVDNRTAEASILGLTPGYGVTTDLPSVVLIGGLSPEEKLHGVKYIIESFMGCIKDMRLSAGKSSSELEPIRPLVASKHDNVLEGCINKCRTRDNLCFVGSHCINHYQDVSCDCYGTEYEGERCDIYTATVLTLRGSSFVSYRIYDWKDRVHSNVNRISLFFKTRFDDSALFYASGETDRHHHIAASIVNGSVVVEMDFWAGPAIVTDMKTIVTNNHWHNLTIYHARDRVHISLGAEKKEISLPGTQHYLQIDPEIYIGGGPELNKKRGLLSNNNFAGSLKYVFFNDVSILYELKKGNPKVHYIGVLAPEFYEADVEIIPLTFPFPSSHIWWPASNVHNNLSLSFEFKSYRSMAVLVSSNVTTASGTGYMEVRVVNDQIRLELIPEIGKNVTHLTTVTFDSRANWHNVDLTYSKGEVRLTVDYRNKQSQLFGLEFTMGDRVIIGSALGSKANTGLVGCMRQVVVNGVPLEPRYVVRTKHTVGTVSLDNCQLVDPCTRPNACEHGGKCSVKDDRVTCDCKGTGYIGKNCHFAEFRKTCEELALLGYTKPDVYLIDIDGNGRFPPAHVKCEFQSLEDATKTIVEHNLPSQVDVRGASESDFSFTIKYREFTSEMLQELISHSLYCSQYIKYDCYKAPLELHSATWFVSSARNGTVDYLGNVKRGSCPCSANRTCVDPDLSCNCDVTESKWHSDEGFFATPSSLGITEMVFLQQKDLDEDALGRITLGPLECVETNTQTYVVTFTTSQSYIEVPGWRKGDIAFSFRTTGENAILLYQPPIRPHLPSFMVALTSDFKLTFNFTLNTGRSRELEIKSQRRLNSGEWQKIWIDYNEHHVRFMINTDYQMVDLLPEEEFGPFEGSMFIGGATEDLLKKSSISQGLIGCFRGLVVNGEVLDIYSYMSVHLSEIIKDCKPSCDPNPCKNGAQCKELWSTFKCVCENPWAYIGQHCETNINVNAMTMVRMETYMNKNFLFNNTDPEKKLLKSMLKENILLNVRTYDANSLLLYANDHLNNFVHLFIQNKKNLVFLFNSGNEIRRMSVQYPGLNSGKSVQIAIIRKGGDVTLHVNDRNTTIHAPNVLLTEYRHKPWINAEKEVLAPQRPPAPPTDYFQMKLGGMQDETLLRVNPEAHQLTGFIGCLRGFKIGNTLYDLQANATNPIDIVAPAGVIPGCRMKCDDEPCKHQGICIEDFAKGESSCNCEHTSYYGEFCGQEKGADFGGESVLLRNFTVEGEVNQVKVQLAFSSNDARHRSTALLLIQTETRRSYYLLVAISAEGELIFEEDREGTATSIGARIKDRNFLNGARHSLYYKRVDQSATLLIDREPVALQPISVLSYTEDKDASPRVSDAVHIGGLKTSDPRFGAYTSYSGCLSNVFVEVNHQMMKPVDEYMAFIKNGSEKVLVISPSGVRSAQCANFDLIHKPRPSPSLNSSLVSVGRDKAWVEDSPSRVPYKSQYSVPSTVEEGFGKIAFIVLTSIFALVMLGVAWDVYRTQRNYRRRKEAEEAAAMLWHKPPPLLPPTAPSPYKARQQQQQQNGSASKPLLKGEPPSAVHVAPPVVPQQNGRQIRFQEDRTDRELQWEPLSEEENKLLDQSLKELSISLGSHGSVSSEEGAVVARAGARQEDPPASAQPLPVKISRGAPISSTSEVTLNSLYD
ncbi:contactin-associated protein-like 2 isoform X2 [Thrips palmi]|uniref:Contactin-associated protein-like 2 isoform X2 n=1 Tax=Thrips palmi TaxID=161013 RepID=A0A6P8ZX83_THRPL|nr:contactin-associated protein-like 2 isoform X2 [Thrips palmi]